MKQFIILKMVKSGITTQKRLIKVSSHQVWGKCVLAVFGEALRWVFACCSRQISSLSTCRYLFWFRRWRLGTRRFPGYPHLQPRQHQHGALDQPSHPRLHHIYHLFFFHPERGQWGCPQASRRHGPDTHRWVHLAGCVSVCVSFILMFSPVCILAMESIPIGEYRALGCFGFTASGLLLYWFLPPQSL